MKRSKMKLSNEAKFRLAVHTALLAGVSTAVMPVSAQEAAADEKATELEAVEVTGSRLGRGASRAKNAHDPSERAQHSQILCAAI